MTGSRPRASVIVPCYTEARWDDTAAAIRSARAQKFDDLEVVVVVDHNPRLGERVAASFPDVTVAHNVFARGASGNRNSGALAARGEVLAFLDDDHVAAPTWLASLHRHVGTPGVLGVGGRAAPVWPVEPKWFPAEFAWVVGATYRGMPEEPGPVRNVWSGNLAITRERFDAVGGFRVGFGKVGTRSRPEDTDFCIRLCQRFPDESWIYEPEALIEHRVPPERATAGFFVRRCWAEGLGKAALRRAVGPDATSTERDYTRRVLPAGAVRGLREAVVDRDPYGLARTTAIVGGLAVTVGGVAAGFAAEVVPRPGARRGTRGAEQGAQPAAQPGAPASRAGDSPSRAPGAGPAPVQIEEMEIGAPLRSVVRRSIPGGSEPYSSCELLVRLQDYPVGTARLPFSGAAVSATAVADTVWDQLGPAITAFLRDAGVPTSVERLTAAGVPLRGELPHREQRAKVAVQAPRVSVVLATRDRPVEAARCLRALVAQSYPDFEVVVVDNAPSSTETRQAVGVVAAETDVSVRYLVEPRPGLSWARNAGVEAAGGDIIAFLDDDERPDGWWLAELVRALGSTPRVGCVSGLVRPAELDNPAQHWFEQFGGHSKGRGFRAALFDARTEGAQSPLYPLPPFGVGANMAFRREALREIGGFAVELGAGTPTRAAEDTLAFTRVMLAGWQMIYEPGAIMHHYHRATFDDLREVFFGYGVGLTAFYATLVRSDPRLIVPLLRLAPTAVRDLVGAGSDRTRGLEDDFPGELLAAQRAGMLRGPVALLRSALRQRRLTKSFAEPGG